MGMHRVMKRKFRLLFFLDFVYASDYFKMNLADYLEM